jgi:RNA polymerase sigma-70 factor (ECF subfamily)
VTRLGNVPELLGDEHERVETMLDAARLASSAERALAELTDAEQDLFLLVAHDGLPVADAARALGLTPVAGRMRLARARRKLRAALKSGGHSGERPNGPRHEIAAAKEKP